jgi:hypothetical protein
MTAPLADGQESADGGRDHEDHGLPEGWRQFPSGRRGARLYRVTPKGGEACWQAEMTLNGVVQRRRLASELHARWWLSALNEPRLSPGVSDWEELNTAWRAGFVHGE